MVSSGTKRAAGAVGLVATLASAITIGYVLTRPRPSMTQLIVTGPSISAIAELGTLPASQKALIAEVDTAGVVSAAEANDHYAQVQAAIPGAQVSVHENAIANVEALLAEASQITALRRIEYDYEPGYPDWVGASYADALAAIEKFGNLVHGTPGGFFAIGYLTVNGFFNGWAYPGFAPYLDVIQIQTQAALKHAAEKGNINQFQRRLDTIVTDFTAAGVPLSKVGVGAALGADNTNATTPEYAAQAFEAAIAAEVGYFYMGWDSTFSDLQAFLDLLA